jgi:hypothetical protein
LSSRIHSATRQGTVISASDRHAPVVLIERGVVFQFSVLPDGRRAIVDLLLPGDVGGLDNLVYGQQARS